MQHSCRFATILILWQTPYNIFGDLIPPFSSVGLDHDASMIIQLVSGSGEAQVVKLVNYVCRHANQVAVVANALLLNDIFTVML